MSSQFALYSDRFFMAAVFVYLLAMVLHACEFARERGVAPGVDAAGSTDAAADAVVGSRAGALGRGVAGVRGSAGAAAVGADPVVGSRAGALGRGVAGVRGSAGAAAVDAVVESPVGDSALQASRIGPVGADAGPAGPGSVPETLETGRATADPPPGAGPAGRSRSERMGRMGLSLVVLGVALQIVSIVLRGLAAGRWPLGNMYEFVSAITCAALVTWLVVLRRHPAMRPLALFVLFPALVLQFLAGTVLFVPAAPVMPALQSYWLVVHVTTISLASGLFFVPGVASLLYLLQRAGRLPAPLAVKVPRADALDRLAYRVTIIAFPVYTFGIIAGAIWAEAAWGRFWGWDPKETVAFVAWVVYAAYLHARATAGWRSGRAAWINVLGLAVIVFNLFFINMVVAGLHSYAGLN